MNLLVSKAETFLKQCYSENEWDNLEKRLTEVKDEIARTGTYVHTALELEHGAKIAWRNSNRCIGRFFWKKLSVRDQRHLTTEKEICDEMLNHIKFAYNDGKIRPSVTVFRQADEAKNNSIKIWNAQLVRYAGYQAEGNKIIGDPDSLEFTAECIKLGWKSAKTDFDILPLVIQIADHLPVLVPIPDSFINEVNIEHPTMEWFKELGLKWYAVPIISNMVLEIGGIVYSAVPFNGWYMETEIASRNFGDEQRYNVLPTLAARMGLDTSKNSTLWKDRALLELNLAVLHSYQKSKVAMVDHHTATDQFINFEESENECGREINADWSWIVPPMSGSATKTFFREWKNEVVAPNFYREFAAWRKPTAEEMEKQAACPFHIHKA